jgi:hypothetical protein
LISLDSGNDNEGKESDEEEEEEKEDDEEVAGVLRDSLRVKPEPAAVEDGRVIFSELADDEAEEEMDDEDGSTMDEANEFNGADSMVAATFNGLFQRIRPSARIKQAVNAELEYC